MERRMLRWWPEQNFTIAHGDGIFEHARLERGDAHSEAAVDDGSVRVCFVHHALWVGGVERQIRLIIDGINRWELLRLLFSVLLLQLIPVSLNSSKADLTFRMILFTELGQHSFFLQILARAVCSHLQMMQVHGRVCLIKCK